MCACVRAADFDFALFERCNGGNRFDIRNIWLLSVEFESSNWKYRIERYLDLLSIERVYQLLLSNKRSHCRSFNKIHIVFVVIKLDNCIYRLCPALFGPFVCLLETHFSRYTISQRFIHTRYTVIMRIIDANHAIS